MKYFDVIFSNNFNLNLLDSFNELLKNQLRNENNFLKSISSSIKNLKNDLTDVLSSYSISFGFNITSSIILVLEKLPKYIVITNKEFPPIISQVFHSNKQITGILDIQNMNYEELFNIDNIDEIIFLISHISYIDGEDILDNFLNSVTNIKQLRTKKIHIIIDGAHSICNNFIVSDIPGLHKKLSAVVNIESFTYVFDFHKWVQGFFGLSVIISSRKTICNSLNHIFPNTLNFDDYYIRFHPPVSVSFNPLLIYWKLNIDNFSFRLFDGNQIKRNNSLKSVFISSYKNNSEIQLILNSNNLISLNSANPEYLYKYLLNNNIQTHLIGGRTIDTNCRIQIISNNVRLAFSSILIDNEDINYLTTKLKQYKYEEKA